MFKKTLAALFASSVFFQIPIATADVMVVPPTGYQQFLTYMGNGEWNPYEPNPVVANCQVNGVCLDDYFGRVVQKRTPAQEAAVAQQAMNYFKWKFGLDFTNPAIAQSVLLAPFTLDPRLNYRAYVMSGGYTPVEGYPVRDGGYVAVLLTDLTLGGEFQGMTYPANTLFIFGENNILIDRPGTNFDEQVVLSYRFGNPVVVDQNGNATVTIDLRHGSLQQTNFGDKTVAREGIAQLVVGTPGVTSAGLAKAKLRTVLTFSANGGL